MKQERWQQIDQLLEATLELPVAQRAAFLAEACADDKTLRQEVESLLRAEEQAEHFIETPAIALAAEVLANKQARSLIGQSLGHYQILSQLGAGGMGEVYLAQDTKLHRRVALKLLPANLTANQDAGRRFLREARAAATLDHPNICAVYEVGEEAGQSFIALQYVEGETLADKLKREGCLETSLELARQIADALAEAHAHQIIHRDIKPANIIITPRGQVKVLDFGLAKLMRGEQPIDSEAETASLLSTPGLVVGTVPYMSPEQVRGERLDARTDIFSFGTLLYEMLSGRRPFEAKSSAEIISAILTQEPPPLRGQREAIPQELERLVRKCLAKEPARRYQRMEEVSVDLARVRRAWESGQITAPLPEVVTANIEATVSQRPVKWQSLLRARTAHVVIAVVILGVAATAYTFFFRHAPLTPTLGSKSVNSAAYDYYMRGKVVVGNENREDNEAAIKLLEQAVKADSNFAPAWAGLARAYNKKAFYLAPGAEKKQLNVDAEVAVEKALALDPDLAEGHYARGLILWTPAKRFPHEQAIQSYKRAIALNPKLDAAHQELGVVYFHIGLLDKGWAEIEKTLEINPANILARFRLGVINIYRAKYEDALTIFNGIPRETNPALWGSTTVTALFQLGRMDEAAALVEDLLKNSPKDEGGMITGVKAMLLAKSGKRRETEEAIQHAIEIGQGFGHFHHTTYSIASAYALLNQPSEAIKWLEESANDGFPCYPLFDNDPTLDSLRKDERFIVLMTKLRKQWEHYQATL